MPVVGITRWGNSADRTEKVWKIRNDQEQEVATYVLVFILLDNDTIRN